MSVLDRVTPPPEDPQRPDGGGPRLTRRQVLGAGLGGAVALAGAGAGVDLLASRRHRSTAASPVASLPPNGTAQRFHSRPDLLPTITRLTVSGRPAPGVLLLGPDRSPPVQGGAMILDHRGELAWFHPVAAHHWAANLRVGRLHGAPVLTWWEGHLDGGYGRGEAIIVDTAYRVLHRVRAARGRQMDLHEFQLTDAGTALFTCTPEVRTVDLSAIGGPSSAHALESIFQEVDVVSGRLLREWRSLDHIPVTETYRTDFAPLDYLHVNSIDLLPKGDLLISARNTWCCYKLARSTGEVIWRLGGKRTDFAMGPGAQFAWQHDGRWVGPGRMTVFDDGFDGQTRTHKLSRGLLLDVDVSRRRAAVARAYTSPAKVLSSGMGNAQLLRDGHVVVGFGDAPYIAEFDASGAVVASLQMPAGQHSYRGFRQPWTGRPARPPATAVRRSRASGRATLYVSWNGATEVAAWRVLGGARRGELRPVARVRRAGFETAIDLGRASGIAVAVALDAQGRELHRSAPIRV